MCTQSRVHIERRRNTMSDLIVIGYPDEMTAELAAGEARRLAQELVIEPDAVAVISRDDDGKFHVTTTHHAVGAGAAWGAFWGMLFGAVFFIPLLPVSMLVGAGVGALSGKLVDSGIDENFQDQVAGLLQPGTSALFLIVGKMTTDKALDGLRPYGGTVLRSSLTKDAERELQAGLAATSAVASDNH
jgi:uncharacterized membrane protein